MDGQTPKATVFRCVTGLRGYHVYQVNWKPTWGQEIVFNQENNNLHDCFAVAGQTKLPGKLSITTVGHIPREISRYFWYALNNGACISGIVSCVKPRSSPLLQGGLEIPISITVRWSIAEALCILKEKVFACGFLEDNYTEYIDSTKDILQEILIDKDVDENSSESETHDREASFESDSDSDCCFVE